MKREKATARRKTKTDRAPIQLCLALLLVKFVDQLDDLAVVGREAGEGGEHLVGEALAVPHLLGVAGLVEAAAVEEVAQEVAAGGGDVDDTLVAVGNARAEYITTEGRGVQHGNRHPHAWSIVEERELVRWMDSLTARAPQR